MEPIPGLTPEDWALAEALRGFVQKYLIHRYDSQKPIPWFHSEWWALFLSNHRQCAIAAPRGHAKSTSITFAFVLFLLCFKVTRHLLILGSNETNAAAFVNELKSELAENDALRAFMEFRRFRKETETELVLEFTNGQKSRILGRGTDQKIRGLKWERKRPDYVVADDMEDEETVLNEQRRKKFERNFYGAVKPIISDNGKIRVVGTIIGFGSFLASVMPNEKKPTTVMEPLRVYSKSPGAWASVKYMAHDSGLTQFLWPELHQREWWVSERGDYAERGMLDTYGQEYLNSPIDATTAYFRMNDFLPMKEGESETRKSYYAAADLAIGETERSAYSVIVVGGLDSDGYLHIVDVRRGRWDGAEIVDEMFSVHSRWQPEMFRVESENIAKSLGPFINRRMDEDQAYINIDAKPPTKDKDKRARSIQARMRAGKVKFDKNAEWYADFEEELTKYPKHPYKDQVDAFAWLGLMLEEMVEPETDQEIEEAEYRMQLEDNFAFGRNAVTGY